MPTTYDAQGVETRDHCKVYNVNYLKVLQEGVTVPDRSWPVRECTAWEYDTTGGYYNTIVTEVFSYSLPQYSTASFTFSISSNPSLMCIPKHDILSQLRFTVY